MSGFFNPSTPAKKWDADSPLLSVGCVHRTKLNSELTTESLTRYEQDFEETKVIAKGRFDV